MSFPPDSRLWKGRDHYSRHLRRKWCYASTRLHWSLHKFSWKTERSSLNTQNSAIFQNTITLWRDFPNMAFIKTKWNYGFYVEERKQWPRGRGAHQKPGHSQTVKAQPCSQPSVYNKLLFECAAEHTLAHPPLVERDTAKPRDRPQLGFSVRKESWDQGHVGRTLDC